MNQHYNQPARNLFSLCLVSFAVVGLVALLIWSKADLFWALNQLHSYPGDMLLRYFTHVGDGIFMLLMAVVAMGLGKRKLGIMMILAFLLSGLCVQVVKRLQQQPRPALYFQEQPQLKGNYTIHRPDQRTLTGRNSFPSGHTTTAFAMFSLLAFATRSKWQQAAFFFAALLAGFSRIYLGHHFFSDVYAGALLGFTTAVVVYWWLHKRTQAVITT